MSDGDGADQAASVIDQSPLDDRHQAPLDARESAA
jgi:hypothetical protein